jgi:hypothetical protein
MKKFGLTGTRPQARKANQKPAATGAATKKRPAPTDDAEGGDGDGDGDGDEDDEEVAVKAETPVKKEKISV